MLFVVRYLMFIRGMFFTHCYYSLLFALCANCLWLVCACCLFVVVVVCLLFGGCSYFVVCCVLFVVYCLLFVV